MKIYIEGIKSIADGQYIGLGEKLTFFVGPNSAGKSSAVSAMKYIMKARESIKKGIDIPNFLLKDVHRDRLGRFADLQSTGVCDGDYEIRYSKSSKWISHEKLMGLDKNKCKLLSKSDLSIDWTDWGWDKELGGKGSASYFFKQEVFLINSTDYIYYGNSFSKNILFINIKKSPITVREDVFQWYVDFLNYVVKMNSSTYIEKSVFEGFDVERRLRFAADGWIVWVEGGFRSIMYYIKDGVERQTFINKMERYNAVLKKFVEKVKNSSLKTGDMSEFVSISPQRVIPSGVDLRSEISLSDADSLGGVRALMMSGVLKSWHSLLSEYFNNYYYGEVKYESLFDDVNRSLSDHLFYDRGYQVKVKSHMLVDSSQWESWEVNFDSMAFKCQVVLIDQHGRELGFDDVGSGIGYVLPILIECFMRDGCNLVLQQPELHLHPAMQAQLCDVLIEAAAHKRIIAETHSEHMILRALKRVRQTSKGTLKDPSLALKPEDIAVNYFEPLPDGSTKVHIMRVSEDGDFIDRWPNGFFSERDQELFDE